MEARRWILPGNLLFALSETLIRSRCIDDTKDIKDTSTTDAVDAKKKQHRYRVGNVRGGREASGVDAIVRHVRG